MLFHQTSHKGLNENALNHLDALLRQFVEAGKIAGGSIAITRGKNSVYRKYFGYADLTAKRKLTRIQFFESIP